MDVAVEVLNSIYGRCYRFFKCKRGQIQGTEDLGNGITVINALVPLAELFGYTSELRSLTSGRGSASMEPSQCGSS